MPGTRPTRGGRSAILLAGISRGHGQLGEAKVNREGASPSVTAGRTPPGAMCVCSSAPGSQQQFAADFRGRVISSENQDVCLLKVMKAFCVCANNF